MKQGFFLLGTAALAMAAACSPGGLGDEEILKVDGVAVMESEFLDELEYQLSFSEVVMLEEGEEEISPHLITEEDLKKTVLSDLLIPMAAVKAKYGNEIPEIMSRAEEIMKKIEPGGGNFDEVAAAHSKDKADVGGSLGVLTRRGYVYPVPRMAFTAEAGEIVGPFLSQVGCHILYVHGKTKGTVPSVDTVRVSHILLPFEEARLDFMAVVLPDLVKKARIEVLSPAYERFVKRE